MKKIYIIPILIDYTKQKFSVALQDRINILKTHIFIFILLIKILFLFIIIQNKRKLFIYSFIFFIVFFTDIK